MPDATYPFPVICYLTRSGVMLVAVPLAVGDAPKCNETQASFPGRWRADGHLQALQAAPRLR